MHIWPGSRDSQRNIGPTWISVFYCLFAWNIFEGLFLLCLTYAWVCVCVYCICLCVLFSPENRIHLILCTKQVFKETQVCLLHKYWPEHWFGLSVYGGIHFAPVRLETKCGSLVCVRIVASVLFEESSK